MSEESSTHPNATVAVQKPPIEEKKKNVRHAEKRRISTCHFADRVAQISVDHYRRVIPSDHRLPQTCIATIVAYYPNDGNHLSVVSMGVGTKFLSESRLLEDAQSSNHYGRRVRDCHAEVLARRAFRRQLTWEILTDLQQFKPNQNRGRMPKMLERTTTTTTSAQYRLIPGVTLHMYASSAPCGNATLKKFGKMNKEKFRDDLTADEWPTEMHEPIHGHSIKMGQFALLVKKDTNDNDDTNKTIITTTVEKNKVPQQQKQSDDKNEPTNKRQKRMPGKPWPANMSDDWTPPGTTIVDFKKGSIHTCSDKICRWNYLGLQGSLLASFLEDPLYMASLTVGRKLTASICRRAVCCRIGDKTAPQNGYRLNHPAVLGTAVYMDETGVVETDKEVRGQDVRFHSSLSWAWWPSIDTESSASDASLFECIDGSTGCLATNDDDSGSTTTEDNSRISTESLVSLFLEAHNLAHGSKESNVGSLGDLRQIKEKLSPKYEETKDRLLTRHRVLRQWKRRFNMITEVELSK